MGMREEPISVDQASPGSDLENAADEGEKVWINYKLAWWATAVKCYLRTFEAASEIPKYPR